VSSIVLNYFSYLSPAQTEKFACLPGLYSTWNEKINVISRKDIDNFEINHLLHSLAIAKFISFSAGTKVIDVGTGGGLPGIPLAIMFPEVQFTLVDSISKKILVASEISSSLDLKNVRCLPARSEEIKGQYDFVIGRAVTEMSRFVGLTRHLVARKQHNNIANGFICLKGGDLKDELAQFDKRITIENISKWFSEPFFETKKIIYLPH